MFIPSFSSVSYWPCQEIADKIPFKTASGLLPQALQQGNHSKGKTLCHHHHGHLHPLLCHRHRLGLLAQVAYRCRRVSSSILLFPFQGYRPIFFIMVDLPRAKGGAEQESKQTRYTVHLRDVDTWALVAEILWRFDALLEAEYLWLAGFRTPF